MHIIGDGGAGGNATATADATANGGGPATATATASGGTGGYSNVGAAYGVPPGNGGAGGNATATADATATSGGAATATATAVGGAGGGSLSGTVGAQGAASASSSATTQKGAMAQAQSTAVGSSGQAQSTAQTSFANLKQVQSVATAQTGSTATTKAIAQAGGSGQAFANPGQTAYSMAVGIPDKAYATTLVGGAGNVAGALLGPRDEVFGTAIMGANYAPDGAGESHTYSAAATFDFGYHGDLMLGLIDNQENGFAGGLGFQSMDFTVIADGSQILDVNLGSLAVADSFFRDTVLDLGWYSGSGVDLTFGYNLVADGSGGFGFDFAVGGAVPEPSTWAMMLLGFAGLGVAGYRKARSAVSVAA